MDYEWIYGMSESEYELLKKVVAAQVEEQIDNELKEAFPDWEPTEEELDDMWEAL